jgi:protein-L-isoaspartate(D-aspartate) O-methyltransferase
MVAHDLAARGIEDAAVLRAMGEVPREEFVPSHLRAEAYDDRPLPIGEGQTISQPYVVALMLELLELAPEDRMLEVGAGSGYAAAVAGRICRRVVGVERLPHLATTAAARLARLGGGNVVIVCDDGSTGWPPEGPYDAVLVSAGAPDVPGPLVDQLADGGRLVVPVGRHLSSQRLLRVRRTPVGLTEDDLGGVTFVPLIGAEGWEG